jgi:hypothetical protein
MSRRLTRLALVALAAGLVLMLGFEATLTRIAGVLALLAFIALGVFAIATPDFLGEDEDRES